MEKPRTSMYFTSKALLVCIKLVVVLVLTASALFARMIISYSRQQISDSLSR